MMGIKRAAIFAAFTAALYYSSTAPHLVVTYIVLCTCGFGIVYLNYSSQPATLPTQKKRDTVERERLIRELLQQEKKKESKRKKKHQQQIQQTLPNLKQHEAIEQQPQEAEVEEYFTEHDELQDLVRLSELSNSTIGSSSTLAHSSIESLGSRTLHEHEISQELSPNKQDLQHVTPQKIIPKSSFTVEAKNAYENDTRELLSSKERERYTRKIEKLTTELCNAKSLNKVAAIKIKRLEGDISEKHRFGGQNVSQKQDPLSTKLKHEINKLNMQIGDAKNYIAKINAENEQTKHMLAEANSKLKKMKINTPSDRKKREELQNENDLLVSQIADLTEQIQHDKIHSAKEKKSYETRIGNLNKEVAKIKHEKSHGLDRRLKEPPASQKEFEHTRKELKQALDLNVALECALSKERSDKELILKSNLETVQNLQDQLRQQSTTNDQNVNSYQHKISQLSKEVQVLNNLLENTRTELKELYSAKDVLQKAFDVLKFETVTKSRFNSTHSSPTFSSNGVSQWRREIKTSSPGRPNANSVLGGSIRENYHHHHLADNKPLLAPTLNGKSSDKML